MVLTFSRTQKIVAQSSAEAELVAIYTAVQEAIGLKTLLAEIGITRKVSVYTDSSAARGFSYRRGLGKLKHIELKYLWIQDLIKSKDIEVNKIKGIENPADLFTKILARNKLQPLLEAIGFYTNGIPQALALKDQDEVNEVVEDDLEEEPCRPGINLPELNVLRDEPPPGSVDGLICPACSVLRVF